MAFEEFANIIWTMISLLSIITAFLAVLVVRNLRKQVHEDKREMKRTLLVVFVLLALGFILWAIAETMWDLYVYILGVDFPGLSLADAFWIIGYLPIILAFSYCWVKFYKATVKKKQIVATTALLAIALVSVLYSILGLILPQNADYGLLEQMINISYPVLSVLVFMSSVIVYFLFKEGTIDLPLLLIAVSMLFAFMGDMLYYFYAWAGTYGLIGIFSDTFYIVEYTLSAVAFYILFRKSRTTIASA